MGKGKWAQGKENNVCFLGYVRMCEKNVSIGTWCDYVSVILK